VAKPNQGRHQENGASSGSTQQTHITIAMGRVLSDRALFLLSRYKYVGAPYTYLDALFSPYQQMATDILPHWVAPNVLTFVGFLFSLIPCEFRLFSFRILVVDFVCNDFVPHTILLFHHLTFMIFFCPFYLFSRFYSRVALSAFL
jgi:hypothetical protein